MHGRMKSKVSQDNKVKVPGQGEQRSNNNNNNGPLSRMTSAINLNKDVEAQFSPNITPPDIHIGHSPFHLRTCLETMKQLLTPTAWCFYSLDQRILARRL